MKADQDVLVSFQANRLHKVEGNLLGSCKAKLEKSKRYAVPRSSIKYLVEDEDDFGTEYVKVYVEVYGHDCEQPFNVLYVRGSLEEVQEYINRA